MPASAPRVRATADWTACLLAIFRRKKRCASLRGLSPFFALQQNQRLTTILPARKLADCPQEHACRPFGPESSWIRGCCLGSIWTKSADLPDGVRRTAPGSSPARLDPRYELFASHSGSVPDSPVPIPPSPIPPRATLQRRALGAVRSVGFAHGIVRRAGASLTLTPMLTCNRMYSRRQRANF